MTSRTLRERVPDAVSVEVGSARSDAPESLTAAEPDVTSEHEFPEQRRESVDAAVTEVTDPVTEAKPHKESDAGSGNGRSEIAESGSAESGSAEPGSAATKSAPQPAAQPLSERERAVLMFEKQYWKYSGAKEQAIRDRFEMSATRYYQVLNALLDRPEAQEFEPVLVKRLRRQRAVRQRARSGRIQPPRPASR